MFIDFRERGKEKQRDRDREREGERNIDPLLLAHTPSRDQTRNVLGYRMTPNQLSHLARVEHDSLRNFSR